MWRKLWIRLQRAIQANYYIVQFAVADVDNVHWERETFDAVALPEDKKDMVLSLAEARTSHLNMLPFDNFVPGKGCGLNVLLQYVLLTIFSGD